jgi:maltooligosyltrehalose trehalohydrolase
MTRSNAHGRPFTVWAPNAESVELVLESGREAMGRAGGGWWQSDATAEVGDRYAFSIDGGPPRPDPRSRDQPEGVHAMSRVVDADGYAWRHPGFRSPPLSAAVVYELHIGTFTAEGTLASAIDRLDHLCELGVTHLEVMPLNAFEGSRGWGYDGVAWYAPHPAYCGGEGPDAVKRFVDACHGRGLAVILDVVYNHLGPSGNYLPEFGPYFSSAYATPWGEALNLDGAHSDGVRRFICDNAMMWLGEYRFDALRLDAVHAYFDRGAVHLLEQMRRDADELEASTGRRLELIAESDLNDPRIVTPLAAGGLGCDAQWSDDFHHALHALVTGEREGYYRDFGAVADLAKALRQAFVRDGGHDSGRQRRHGRAPRGLNGDRFFAYIQNHDQVGNRAAGDRIAASLSDDQLRACAAFVLLGPFVPMLFQGEEWAASTPFMYFTDHRGEELAEAVRKGRRSEFAAFGWRPEDVPDPQAEGTFAGSKLDWREPDASPHAGMLAWHRELIALRGRLAPLCGKPLERTRVDFDESAGWLVMRNGAAVVGAAFAGEGRGALGEACGIPLEGVIGEGERCALAARTDGVALDEGRASVPRGGCAVLEVVSGSGEPR